MEIPTIRLRLAKHEAGHLVAYFYAQIDGKMKKRNVRNELIVMGEYYTKLFLKATKQVNSYKNSPVVYYLPLSIARILHERLQNDCPSQVLQNLLNDLDQQLVNINMKPDLPRQLSIV